MNSHQIEHESEHESGDQVLEQRILLPQPDAENITVLTRELPNAPILPWHRFDSPWLQQAESEPDAVEQEQSVEALEDDILEDDIDNEESLEDSDSETHGLVDGLTQLSIFEVPSDLDGAEPDD